jgi:FKBP-type peptidyl-prolyl cis-trans isomerase
LLKRDVGAQVGFEIKALLESKIKIFNIESILYTLSRTQNFHEVSPLKLCYKIQEIGKGVPLDDKHPVILANLRIAQDGKLVYDAYSIKHPVKLDLTLMIPGLAHGMLGMHIGEKRTILIHPDFAYGNCSNFERAALLTVDVQLVNVLEEKGSLPFPELVSVDSPFQKSCDLATVANRDFAEQEFGRFKGYETWAYLKHGFKQGSLSQILDCMPHTDSSNTHVEFTKKKIDLLLDLHWSICHTIDQETPGTRARTTDSSFDFK